MENELQILKSIEKNNYITQRDISKSTGMSLGNVNILIKRLARKGLLKIERLNPRTIRYIITPQGMKEKLERTYSYISTSIRLINDINQKIDHLIDGSDSNNLREIYLFGENDDVHAMLKSRLRTENIDFISIYELNGPVPDDITAEQIVIVWQSDFIEALKASNINYVNLLEKV